MRSGGERERPAPKVTSAQTKGATPSPSAASTHTVAGILGLQRTIGNRAVRRLLDVAQPKLTVGPAGDRFEREADQVADEVMRPRPPSMSRTSEVTDEEQVGRVVERLNRAGVTPGPIGLDGGDLGSETETKVKNARGGGRNLPSTVRTSMEKAMGADFGGVRVHAGPDAQALNRSMQARAFTVGRDIFFGRSQFRPGTAEGQRLIAHELTHTLQQGGTSLHRETTRGTQEMVVQRQVMSATDILSALSGISFVKKKLAQSLDLRRTGQDPAAESMRQHVVDVLQQYETHLKGKDHTVNQAMMIAAVLERVARVIAVNELNDPALVPTLSVKLLELYRSTIESKLKTMDNRDEALTLAHALVADDPLALYMHDELRIEAAARRIRTMAFGAAREPSEMFDLLRQKFEMEMATHTKASVENRQDSSAVYNLKEATGEISSKYFERLFGKNVAAPTWSGGAKSGLTFTADSTRRLDELKAAVSSASQVRSATPMQGLTIKQTEHLEGVEEEEKKISYSDVNAAVEAALVTILGVTAEEATVLRRKVQDGLKDIPIILAVGGLDWFGTKVPDPSKGETAYKAFSGRRNEAKFSKLFGKRSAKGSIKHLGEFPRPEFQDRGKNYLRFRNWKDQVMSGKRGFSDEELPTFAAMSTNWDAEGSMGIEAQNYGVSPYGDTQFRLNPALLKQAIFTATDHGFPRRDPYLAFTDLLIGGEGVTRLKDTKSVKHALHVLNSVTTKKAVASPTQPFEIQIFGQIDIAKDVEMIYVAPSAPQAVKDNVRKFSKATGVPCKFIEVKPGVEQETYLLGSANLMEYKPSQAAFARQIKKHLADERGALTLT